MATTLLKTTKTPQGLHRRCCQREGTRQQSPVSTQDANHAHTQCRAYHSAKVAKGARQQRRAFHHLCPQGRAHQTTNKDQQRCGQIAPPRSRHHHQQANTTRQTGPHAMADDTHRPKVPSAPGVGQPLSEPKAMPVHSHARTRKPRISARSFVTRNASGTST